MRQLPGPRLTFFDDWTREAELATERGEDRRTTRQDGADPAPRRGAWAKRATALGALAAAGVAATVVLPGATANADPSANDWSRLRMCESGNNYSINTGNAHYGAYQFDLSTWRSVGGSGFPQDASPGEQDARALILYRERGWQPWQCSAIVGLRNDSDAGSGRISDIHVPGSGSGGSGSGSGGSGSGSGGSGSGSQSVVPAYPGSRSYELGDSSATIKALQNRMHVRGFFPPGTGRYGPLTLAMVKRLQKLNGIRSSGLLGPKTWRAAWVGRYWLPTTTSGTSAPAFAGTTSFSPGDNSRVIKAFQNQMHARGFFPPGTGQYGPLTLAMVKRLQKLNGIRTSGLLGPKTWRAAFVGKYTRP